MPGRICRTEEEAFQAGWSETCDHDLDPAECPACGLTGTEIARLAVLLGHLAPTAPAGQAAA
ncbi:hypothetical protein [Streptomyces antibioticus]|uniref:hypothetical protein n=1 Tax=Streptomyces antibioticus TaxID=1890 RepID=UPI0036D1C0D1